MYGLHNTLLLSLDMLADHLLCACKIPIFHTFIEGIVLLDQGTSGFYIL